MRRIEALTGPEAVELMRRHDDALTQRGGDAPGSPERVPEAVDELRGRVRQLERAVREGGGGNGAIDIERARLGRG